MSQISKRSPKKPNCWSFLDDVLHVCRSKSIPPERKLFLLNSVVHSVVKSFKLTEKDLDDNLKTLIKSFLVWFTQNIIELLCDTEFVLIHKTLIYTYCLILKHLISVSAVGLLDITKVFEEIIKCGLRKQTKSHFEEDEGEEELEENIFSFCENKDCYYPSYISQRKIKINISLDTDFSSVYYCFIVMVETILARFLFSSSHIVYIIFLITDIILSCRNALKSKAINLVSKLFVKLHHPLNFDVWLCLKCCILEFKTMFQSRYIPEHLTIHSMTEIMKHIIHIGGMKFEKSNEEIFSLSLKLLLILQHCKKLDPSIVTEWIYIVRNILKFTSLNINDLNDILHLVFIAHENQSVFPIIEECLLQSVRNFILIQSKECNSSSLDDINSRPTVEIKTIYVSEHNFIWEKLLQKLPEIFDLDNDLKLYRNYKHLRFIAQAIRIGCNLKYALQSEHPGYDLVFFDSDVQIFMNKISLIFQENITTFTVLKLQVLVDLVSTLLTLLDGNLHGIKEIYNLFMIPWQEDNLPLIDLETKLKCLDGLMYISFLSVDGKQDIIKVVKLLLNKVVHECKEQPLVISAIKIFTYFFLKFGDKDSKKTVKKLLGNLILTNLNMIFEHNFGEKFLCLLSNSCELKRNMLSWELYCADCDNISPANLIPDLGLKHYVEYIGMEYCDRLLGKKEGYDVKMCSFLKRYSFHAPSLKSDLIITKLSTAALDAGLDNRNELIKHIWFLIYNQDGSVNINNIKTIYKSICTKILETDNLPKDKKEQVVMPIIQIIKHMSRPSLL